MACGASNTGRVPNTPPVALVFHPGQTFGWGVAVRRGVFRRLDLGSRLSTITRT